jgi:hypothetical protein
MPGRLDHDGGLPVETTGDRPCRVEIAREPDRPDDVVLSCPAVGGRNGYGGPGLLAPTGPRLHNLGTGVAVVVLEVVESRSGAFTSGHNTVP